MYSHEFNACIRVYDVISMVLVRNCARCGVQTISHGTFYKYKEKIQEGLRAQGIRARDGLLCVRCNSRERYYVLNDDGEPYGRAEAAKRRRKAGRRKYKATMRPL